ncbi:hypothetical protein S245_037001, partial [Arachis hypogaea]
IFSCFYRDFLLVMVLEIAGGVMDELASPISPVLEIWRLQEESWMNLQEESLCFCFCHYLMFMLQLLVLPYSNLNLILYLFFNFINCNFCYTSIYSQSFIICIVSVFFFSF